MKHETDQYHTSVTEKRPLPDGRNYAPDPGMITRPPNPPPPLPPGPPRPSANAKGSLSIRTIHDELYRIYNDCIRDTNAAFRGEAPEPGDHSHEAQEGCRTCTLQSANDWRCAAGIGWAGTEWCNDVTMEYETVCQVPAVEVEGFFQCENVNEWFVQLNNFFHYRLELGYGISRDLYQTAEIRVYCDGWKPNMFPGTGGKIKVVHLPPIISYGPPGHYEQLLDIATWGKVGDLVINGLRRRYLGKVAKMMHIINVDKLSGSSASSLGLDGDESTPLNQRKIIWDIPEGMVVDPS